jgi:tagatose-1,6-bisphosphate aldolase
VGLLVAIEKSGYVGDPAARQMEVLDHWGVGKIKRMGANAVKMLAYYHPQSGSAAQVEALVERVAADCAEHDIPFLLEPIVYSPDPARKKVSADERRELVLESARRLTPRGVDILKAEFPLDIEASPSHDEWRRACDALSEASRVPWVLLGASVAFDTFLRQSEIALSSGASGVAVGRAIWKEATSLEPTEREVFFRTTARERMARVTALCEALARPWQDGHGIASYGENWHSRYES